MATQQIASSPPTPTKKPVVSPEVFRAASEQARLKYGDSVLLGEPYLDRNGRVFAEVHKFGKFQDTAYLGPPMPHALDGLIGPRPESNAAWDDLCLKVSKPFTPLTPDGKPVMRETSKV